MNLKNQKLIIFEFKMDKSRAIVGTVLGLLALGVLYKTYHTCFDGLDFATSQRVCDAYTQINFSKSVAQGKSTDDKIHDGEVCGIWDGMKCHPGVVKGYDCVHRSNTKMLVFGLISALVLGVLSYKILWRMDFDDSRFEIPY